MKHLAIALAMVVLLTVPASSQIISFGLGANVTFPSADLKDNLATGYGLSGMAKFGLLPLVDLTGGVEYTKFTDKDIASGTGSGSAFGIMVGGRMSVLVVGYIGAETGSYTFNMKATGADNNTYTKGFFAPMIGVKFTMFDLSARYVSAGNDSFWGLRGLVWL